MLRHQPAQSLLHDSRHDYYAKSIVMCSLLFNENTPNLFATVLYVVFRYPKRRSFLATAAKVWLAVADETRPASRSVYLMLAPQATASRC